MRNKKVLIAILLIVLFGVVGGTIAYYTSQDTFTNEFNTGKYVIKTEETFESPDNWIPGDTTPKEVSVTNQGNVDAAVKVCFREKWEDENGNPLSLKIGDLDVAYSNFPNGYRNYWLKDCNSNCYYYYKRLEPNETTEDLLESVTYNPYIDFGNTRTCTEDPTTHKQTCINSVNGYSGGKYTLYIDIETVQFDQYQTVFGNVNVCEENSSTGTGLNISRSIPTSYRVGYYLINDYLRESELSSYDVAPSDCTVVYANTISNDNKYYKCDVIVYEDDMYNVGDTVSLHSLTYRGIPHGRETLQPDGSYLYESASIFNSSPDTWMYRKSYYSFDDDDEVMNFSGIESNNWNGEYGYLNVTTSSMFTMPRHNVYFTPYFGK